MTQTDKARGPELLPCPFCASGPASAIQNASFSGVELLDYRGHWFVNCGTCGTEGPKMTVMEETIASWNRRADLAPTPPAFATSAQDQPHD